MEYQGIYKALVASHKNEQALINDCKVMISKIWDNAQNVKSAIRMAANEVDKITELQRRVKDEQSKVSSRREEEDDKRGTIAVLQAEISALDKKAGENHELEEQVKLKQLQNEYGELMKLKEDQQQRQELQRTRERALLDEKMSGEKKVHAATQEIENMHDQIR